MVSTAIQLVVSPQRKIFSCIRSGQIPTRSPSLPPFALNGVNCNNRGGKRLLNAFPVCFSVSVMMLPWQSSTVPAQWGANSLCGIERGATRSPRHWFYVHFHQARWCTINLLYQTCPRVWRVKEYSMSSHQEDTNTHDLAVRYSSNHILSFYGSFFFFFLTPTVFHTHQFLSYQAISRISCSAELLEAFLECDSF